jgi:hypothetical protein
MLSKWKIWDYVNGSRDKNLPFGIYALSSYDTFFISSLKKYLTANVEFVTLNSSDITTTWVDSNFKSLGLFGNTDSFCINLSGALSADVKDMFLNDELMLEGRHLFFIFDKADDFFKKLTQLEYVNGIKIEAPAFWENDKLLDFVADSENVLLSFGAKQKIIEYVDPTVSNFYNVINKLKVNFGQESISEIMLGEVLEKNKLDHFEMANLFGYKKMANFYKKLLDIDPDFESLRSLFYFLQTHMSKISDPRYIEKKSKPSKYDKQILSQSKVWKLNELLLVMEFLRTLEHKAKIKNNFLKSDLRSAYYRAL